MKISASNVSKNIKRLLGDRSIYIVSGLAGVSDQTLRNLLNKTGQSNSLLRSAVKVNNVFGNKISVGQLFCDPDDIETFAKYKDSDMKYLSQALVQYRMYAGLTKKDVANRLSVSQSTYRGYEQNGSNDATIKLNVLQILADIYGIEVADFFMPVSEENIAAVKRSFSFEKDTALRLRSPLITSVCNVAENFMQKANELGISYRNYDSRMMKIIKTLNVSTADVDLYAQQMHTSLGNLMLNRGIVTNWYKDTRSVYFANNLDDEIKRLGITRKEFAEKQVIMSYAYINSLCDGIYMPTLSQAQYIANYLDVEVADLFLPPE